MSILPLPTDAMLRQFARAVAADRLAGDELAQAVLSELGHLDESPQTERAEAFRRFIVKWRQLVESDQPVRPFSNAALIRSIGPLPAEERLAVLLSDVSDFGGDEVEHILAPLSQPIDGLLRKGRQAVATKHQGRRAVVVEDEPLIAADLKEILESIGVEVVAMARTAEMGAQAAITEKPDVVLADYNLDGRKTGVDAVLAFRDYHQCPIIFITGHPKDVLSGEQIEPDFVIVKPYRPEAVLAAVAHCLETAPIPLHDEDMSGRDEETGGTAK